MLHSISSSFPNEIIGIDLIGPYPRSSTRNRYVVVVVDHFSKWVELIPLPKASAEAVRDAVLNNYILKYGAPLKIISDNGPQFVSSLFADMCRKLNIKHSKTLAYRPQSNITERYNRSIIKMIASYVNDCHSQWDKHLQEFAFSLRTTPSDTTKLCPSQLFLGRKIITPINQILDIKKRHTEYQCPNLEEIFIKARNETQKAQKIQQHYYNLRRREPDLQIGDKVLKETHFLSSAPNQFVSKFAPKFSGPYTIIDVHDNVYKVQNENTTISVNADQVKRYYEREKMPSFSSTSTQTNPAQNLANDSPIISIPSSNSESYSGAEPVVEEADVSDSDTIVYNVEEEIAENFVNTDLPAIEGRIRENSNSGDIDNAVVSNPVAESTHISPVNEHIETHSNSNKSTLAVSYPEADILPPEPFEPQPSTSKNSEPKLKNQTEYLVPTAEPARQNKRKLSNGTSARTNKRYFFRPDINKRISSQNNVPIPKKKFKNLRGMKRSAPDSNSNIQCGQKLKLQNLQMPKVQTISWSKVWMALHAPPQLLQFDC